MTTRLKIITSEFAQGVHEGRSVNFLSPVLMRKMQRTQFAG